MRKKKRKSPPVEIDGILAGLVEIQERLEAYLQQEVDDVQDAVRVFELYGRNAATLGRLLRDRQALSEATVEGLSEVIGQALDELAKEWKVDL